MAANPGIFGPPAGRPSARRRHPNGTAAGNVGPLLTGLTAALTMSAGFHRLVLFEIVEPVWIDAGVFEVKNTGTSRTAKLGVYAQAANGRPGAVVVDAGEASTDTIGVKTVAFPPVYLPAGLYFGALFISASTQVEGMGNGQIHPAGVSWQQFNTYSGYETTLAYPSGSLPHMGNVPLNIPSSGSPYLRWRISTAVQTLEAV